MSIKISSLRLGQVRNNTGFVFSDMHLDIDIRNTDTDKKGILSKAKAKDIIIDFDEQAIKNSLINLFNTRPGQKILNPLFGLDLSQWLFYPCSVKMGKQIANTMLQGIRQYEPRVKVSKIDVIALPEQDQYNITLILAIPKLSNSNVSFTGVLNHQGFNEIF